MKRVNLFLIAAFVAASSMLVVSCTDDDDPENAPVINVIAKVGDESAVIYDQNKTMTLKEGTSLCFDVTVKMGKVKVETITVTSDRFNKALVNIDKSGLFTSAIENWKMSEDKDKDGEFYGQYCTSVGNAKEILTFTATAKKGVASSEIVVTIEKEQPDEHKGDGEITYYVKSISVGCQKHATNPSFYSVLKGQSLMLSGAKANPGDVDLVFYFKDFVKVGCPSGEVKTVTFGKSTISTLFGSTYNDLKFIVGDKPAKYTEDWWAGNVEAVDGTSATTEVQIAENKVVFFKKPISGKPAVFGAFLVKSVSAQSDAAAMTIDIIVNTAE